MYIPSSLYPTAYQSIVSRARASPDCTTFLLVSPDVDALCAARALAFLFKQDDVVARIHPVAGWDHVHDMRVELEDKDVSRGQLQLEQEAIESTRRMRRSCAAS